MEIGPYQGGTALLAKMITDEVYSIDPKEQRDPDFNDGLGINFIVGTSEEVAKDWIKPIGVLFIDGNHEEAGIDFLLWERFVVKEGYVLIHDYTGQNKVVQDCNYLMRFRDDYNVLYVPKLPTDKTSILQLQKTDG